MSQNGKGSRQRPKTIDNKTWTQNWNRIFKSGKHHKSKNKYRDWETDRKSTRLNSSHLKLSRMPSSA